jgi:hypothetical protein
MYKTIFAVAALSISGCATLTNDPMTPVTLSFSNGAYGHCDLSNKRGSWKTQVPDTVNVRRSDDVLQYRCKTDDGQDASGSIPSTMGGKIVASAVFLDFGIVDSITDKHREYPSNYVVPVSRPANSQPNPPESTEKE